MLDKESPDLVQICVPPQQVPGFTEICLKRGIAVMTEKPLAMDLATFPTCTPWPVRPGPRSPRCTATAE